MPDPNELTPQERALQAEGNAMLREIAKNNPPATPILGPDGNPIPPKEGVMKAELSDPRLDHIKKMEEARRKRTDELHAELKNLTENDKDALDLCAVLLASHQLVMWAKTELFCRTDSSEELVEFAERFMRETAYQKPYTLQETIYKVKADALTIAEKFRRESQRKSHVRSQKLKRIAKALRENSFVLPNDALISMFKGKFGIGEVLVLYGKRTAVRDATAFCAKLNCGKGMGQVHYLSSREEPDPKLADTVMPPAWWKNAACSMKKLYETLQPIVDREAVLTIVENVEDMYLTPGSGGQDFGPLRRKSMAIARLYQWARENAATVIIGDATDEDVPNVKVYGYAQHAFVEHDKEKLLIAGEAIKG